MDDLERLFRGLVDVLRAQGLERPIDTFEVSELYQSIIPYRKYKKALRFDASQDYEMAVLRLLAGEAGYASVEPVEVQQALLEETQSVNPNPAAFREFAAARVRLNQSAVQAVARSNEAYAPPSTPEGQEDEEFGDEQESKAAVFEPIAVETAPRPSVRPAIDEASLCPHCREELPVQPQLIFCPFCGKRVRPVECPGCGSDIEPNWKFCITCGHSSTSG